MQKHIGVRNLPNVIVPSKVKPLILWSHIGHSAEVNSFYTRLLSSCVEECMLYVCTCSKAGLSTVPVVRGWPPMNCQFFLPCCVDVHWRLKKGRQLFGRRKVHPKRENPGYVYEKRAPALRWYGAPEWLIRPWLAAHKKNLTLHFWRTITHTITAYSVSGNMLRVQRLRYMHLCKMTKDV